jgi:hypothetical protein
MKADVQNNLSLFLASTSVNLASNMRRGDELAATINLLGLRVAAAAENYFGHMGLRSDVADSWWRLKRTSKDIGGGINRALDNLSRQLDVPALAHHPDYLSFSEPDLGDIISRLDVIDIHVEELSDLLAVSDVLDGFLDVQSRIYKNSPFVTPSTLNVLLALSLVPDSRELVSIYDPACGFGGSLLASHSVLCDRGRAEDVRFYGQDVNPQAISVAAWRFLLRGITNFALEVGDTLLDPRFRDGEELQQFDLVVSVPPLYPTAVKDMNKDDPFRRFRYGAVNRSRAEYAFVQHVLASTAPKGRAAIALALSALSRSGYEQEIRSRIVHADLLETVVYLPANVLVARSGSFLSSSVALFDLEKPAEWRDRIFFIDANEVAVATEDTTYLSADVLERVMQIYAQKSEHTDLSSWASLDDIRSRDYVLLPQVYISRTPTALPRIEELEERIEELNRALGETLSEFDDALVSLRDRE